MAKPKSGYKPGPGLPSRPAYLPGLNNPLTPPGARVSGINRGGRPKGQSKAPAIKRPTARLTSP